MTEPLTLLIPAEARFRAIASDLAGRFAELAGGARDGVSAAVAEAVEAVAKSGGGAAEIHLTFRPSAAAIDVDLRCGTATRTISCPL
jgi:hypothetical protein